MFLFARVFGHFFFFFSYCCAVFRKGVFFMKSAVLLIFGMLVRNKVKIVNIWLQRNYFVFCADNTILLKLLFVPCILNLLQIKYIFLRVSQYLKIKNITFSWLLYLVPSSSCPGCLVYLRWVFIKSVFAVGSEEVAVGDTLIFKNIAFFRNCILCLSLVVFDWEIVWVVCCGCFLIDFTIDCRDSLSCLFWRFVFWLFLIEWLCGLFVVIVCVIDFTIDCSGWLFFVERLWFCGKEEKLWSDGALQCCRC